MRNTDGDPRGDNYIKPKENAYYKIGVMLGAYYVFVCFPFLIQCIEKAPVHSANQAQEMHILE